MKLKKIPLITPLSPNELYKKIKKQFKNSFIFTLGAKINEPSKLTIIGFDPCKVIILNNEESNESIFARLRKELAPYVLVDTTNTFAGGLVGVVAYDSIRTCEILPDLNKNDKRFPDALFGLFLDGIVYDHRNGNIDYFYHPKTISRSKIIKKILDNTIDLEESLCVGPLEYQISKEDFTDQVLKIKE